MVLRYTNMEYDLNPLYEKVGILHGEVKGLHSRMTSMEEKIDSVALKIDENTKLTEGLRMRVSTISAGVGTVVTLVVSFVWNTITGKTP